MRQLKKLLALVLALVMTMGLATIGADAAVTAGDLTIKDGQTYTMTGNENPSAVTVEAGGTLVVKSTATMTTGALTVEGSLYDEGTIAAETLTTGASSIVNLGATSSTLAVSGDATINGGSFSGATTDGLTISGTVSFDSSVSDATKTAVKGIANSATDTKIDNGTTGGDEPTGENAVLTLTNSDWTLGTGAAAVQVRNADTNELIAADETSTAAERTYTIPEGTNVFVYYTADTTPQNKGVIITSTEDSETEYTRVSDTKFSDTVNVYGYAFEMPGYDITVGKANSLAVVYAMDGVTLTSPISAGTTAATAFTDPEPYTEKDAKGNETKWTVYTYTSNLSKATITNSITNYVYKATNSTTGSTSTAGDVVVDGTTTKSGTSVALAVNKGNIAYLYPAVKAYVATQTGLSAKLGGTGFTANTVTYVRANTGAEFVATLDNTGLAGDISGDAMTDVVIVDTTDGKAVQAAKSTVSGTGTSQKATYSTTIGTSDINIDLGYLVKADSNVTVTAVPSAETTNMFYTPEAVADGSYVAAGAKLTATPAAESNLLVVDAGQQNTAETVWYAEDTNGTTVEANTTAALANVDAAVNLIGAVKVKLAKTAGDSAASDTYKVGIAELISADDAVDVDKNADAYLYIPAGTVLNIESSAAGAGFDATLKCVTDGDVKTYDKTNSNRNKSACAITFTAPNTLSASSEVYTVSYTTAAYTTITYTASDNLTVTVKKVGTDTATAYSSENNELAKTGVLTIEVGGTTYDTLTWGSATGSATTLTGDNGTTALTLTQGAVPYDVTIAINADDATKVDVTIYPAGTTSGGATVQGTLSHS